MKSTISTSTITGSLMKICDTAIDRVRAIITAEQCKINGEEVDWIVNKYKEDL